MFEEPDENFDGNETPAEDAIKPAERAREKADEFRMHAELVAIFEGVRKFDAQILPKLDLEVAREIQKTIAKLAKAKTPESPSLAESSAADAVAVLNLPQTRGLTTNDYHIHRRPGETMIVRWLAGEQVEKFYERMQAHFDAALNQFREEAHQALEWKQEPGTREYLEALDALDVKMPDRYLRDVIRQHNVFVLSDQTADEMEIVHLCDYVMGVEVAEVVGRASAPPEDGATERDRAWFFKLFSLRGTDNGVEKMCFFTFLQKAEDTFEF